MPRLSPSETVMFGSRSETLLLLAGDHVVVGQDVAVGAHHDARAEAAGRDRRRQRSSSSNPKKEPNGDGWRRTTWRAEMLATAGTACARQCA